MWPTSGFRTQLLSREAPPHQQYHQNNRPNHRGSLPWISILTQSRQHKLHSKIVPQKWRKRPDPAIGRIEAALVTFAHWLSTQHQSSAKFCSPEAHQPLAIHSITSWEKYGYEERKQYIKQVLTKHLDNQALYLWLTSEEANAKVVHIRYLLDQFRSQHSSALGYPICTFLSRCKNK